MKKITAILFFLMCTSFAYSQYRGYDEWIASVGINVLDNSAHQDPVKGSEKWSFSHPITIGIEYKFDENWAINPMLSFNKVDEVYEDSAHGGAGWIEGGNYTSFDVNGKYYFDEYIARNDKIDAYGGLGLGYFKVADESNVSGNINLGMRFWFTPEFGVRLQGLAKFAFDNDKVYANNNILYTLELLYRF
ncbi:outer membrane beta-barrel protein [Formosa sp. PL04]|uniref:outer membrane beta-barrel protein n=1 Tax=Formosa sp. PL04 TaxID=3081755 RepID=UPI002980CD5E|nr:outer membrane beta-barrel protein [Formosa sp. PL04]MDW5287856.1 outer membrane beta-barrel protein [Formosa sp. PL04]